ncbi:hypothetical protein SAMN05421509_109121 [Chromohalobacter canadensis]|uniref:Uncharacterized protein n=1 Tax=Chromohalobacter canadensis TaxID=141389 RepID=A0A285VUA8_9GAMM|nr:hypothetical protein SAMN05421509_109121 [Chromohalobacter canadensis]
MNDVQRMLALGLGQAFKLIYTSCGASPFEFRRVSTPVS